MEDWSDKARAALAAFVVNGLIGAALIAGLAVGVEKGRDSSIETFDIAIPVPPSLVAVDEGDIASGDLAPAGEQADPLPIEAPKPVIAVAPARPAAPVAGDADRPAAGAADIGAGIGAGGQGSGSGGGGKGTAGAFTPARLVSGSLGRRDYRPIRRLGIREGQGDLLLLVGPGGRVERCRAFRSSGSAQIDDHLCSLLVERLRFLPARDVSGRPIRQEVHYVARWGRR